MNNGETTINAKLTADIVVNENVLKADGSLKGNGSGLRLWTPIGNHYDGTFDGQGHTISGLYFNDDSQEKTGLFSRTYDNSKIQNVGIIDSYFYAGWHVGGLSAYNSGTITNCYNTSTVAAKSDNASAKRNAGGICGTNIGTGTITNCYSTGFVKLSVYKGDICGGCEEPGTIENCYYMEGSGLQGIGYGPGTTTAKAAEQFASGEVAWLLNGGTAEGELSWYQKLGKVGDQSPVLKSNGNNTVYFDGTRYYNTLVTISDGTAYEAETDRDGVDVVYERTFSHTGWQALFIPFSMTYDDWKDYGRVAELSLVSIMDGGLVLTWNVLEEGSTVEAGRPYIFEPKSASSVSITVPLTILKAASCAESVSVKAVDGTVITVSGTFTGKTDMHTSGAYALKGGLFNTALSDEAVLNPQRIYLTLTPGTSTTSAPASISSIIDK